MNFAFLFIGLVFLALTLTIFFVVGVIRRGAIELPVKVDNEDRAASAPPSTQFNKKVSLSKDIAGTQGRRVFTIAWGFGLFGMLFFSLSAAKPLVASIFGNSLLIAGGALFIGGLLGFLFGIPRTSQADPSADSSNGAARNTISYKVNTNLEQISDWLTKILVGVGLTQLAKIPEHVDKLARSLAPALGANPSSGVYGISLIVFFISTGFLFGYMVTRIYITRIFQAAEKSLTEKVDDLEKKTEKIDDLEKKQLQSNLDAAALDIASKLLSGTSVENTFNEKEISDAFAKASSFARLSIFNQASSIRANNWKANKAIMEKVIPVFKGLIQSEKTPGDHRYWGELAFALKDSTNPDFAEARKYFTIAIDMRGDYHHHGYTIYEYCRAVCNIKLDQNFQQKKESSEATKTTISKDLDAIIWEVGIPGFNDLTKYDPEIPEWISLNNYITP